MKKKKRLLLLLVALVAVIGTAGMSMAYATGGGTLTADLAVDSDTGVTYGMTKEEIGTAIQTRIGALNTQIAGVVGAKTGDDAKTALDTAYYNRELLIFSRVNNGQITVDNQMIENGKAYVWSRVGGEQYVLSRVMFGKLNDGSDPSNDMHPYNEGSGGGHRVGQIHMNYKTKTAVLVVGVMQQILDASEGRYALGSAIADAQWVNTGTDGAPDWHLIQNFEGGYAKSSYSDFMQHDGYWHFPVTGNANDHITKGKNFDYESKTEKDLTGNAVGTVGAHGFENSRDGLKLTAAEGTKIEGLFTAAYEAALSGDTYGTPFKLGHAVTPVREDFGDHGWERGPNSLGENYVQRFGYGDSTAPKFYNGTETGGMSALVYNKEKSAAYIIRNEFLTAFNGNRVLGVPQGNDFAIAAVRCQNFATGYIKVQEGAETVVPNKNIDTEGKETILVIEKPAAPTVELDSNKYISSPNGKDWTDIEAAFNTAIADINDAIETVLNGSGNLDEAVANGTIPFYSATTTYLTSSNLTKYGEAWASKYKRQETLILNRLNDGTSNKDEGEWWAQDGYAAGMVYNAKTGGVIYVTGKFVNAWNQEKLGMPNADAFTVDGVRYQNFQKGYLKLADGEITLTERKNVDGEGAEESANANVSGWYGMMGLTGAVLPNSDSNPNEYVSKNTGNFATDAEVKAFSLKASAYYDSLIESGYNPGYSGKLLYEYTSIRGLKAFPVDNLYYGDSTAMCYGETDRPNWTCIAYNPTTKTFFTIKNEIMRAMEAGGENGNYLGSLEIGAPFSDEFSVNAGDKAGRYQLFDDGYIAVKGLEPSTVPNDSAVSVFKAADDGYVSIVDVLKGAYDEFKNGAAKTAFDLGADAYVSGFAEFQAAYNAQVPADAKGIADAYNALSAAYDGLITKQVQEAYTAALEAVNAIANNDDKTYTAASYALFVQKAAEAKALPGGTSAQMTAKTAALNAARALLVTTQSVFDAAKADAQALLDGNNSDLFYTGSSFAAFSDACEKIAEPVTNAEKEAAAAAYRAAIALLNERLEMGDLGVQNGTLTSGDNYTFAVTGDGDGAVTIVIVSGGDIASIAGNVLTVNGSGTVVVRISKAGGDTYYDKSVDVTFTVNKKAASAPEAPEVESVTENSVKVAGGEGLEYRLGESGEWVASGSFTGLSADTEYVIYVRYAETADTEASDAVTVSVKTTAKKGCSSAISLQATAVAALALALAGIALFAGIKRKKQA